jgi:hypothetical protein
MEWEYSLLCSQQPSVGSYTRLVQFNPLAHTLLLQGNDKDVFRLIMHHGLMVEWKCNSVRSLASLSLVVQPLFQALCRPWESPFCYYPPIYASVFLVNFSLEISDQNFYECLIYP